MRRFAGLELLVTLLEKAGGDKKRWLSGQTFTSVKYERDIVADG